MPIIKRYSNRKLYNTETKRYISLSAIAALIRQGAEVQVIDRDSGEDLTALVLSQIILEQEKQQRNSLPKSVLIGLVRASGATLGVIRQGLTVPLDLLRQVDAEIDQRLGMLAASGEIADDERQRLREKLLAAREGLGSHPDQPVDTALERALAARGLAKRSDLWALAQQIDRLASGLDELVARRGD